MSEPIVDDQMNQQKNAAPLPGAWTALHSYSGSIFSTTSIVRFSQRSNRKSAPRFLRQTTSTPWRRPGRSGCFSLSHTCWPRRARLAVRSVLTVDHRRCLRHSLESRQRRFRLAATFSILVCTRICVGIGEGGYGPAAPTILADLFPLQSRGRILAIFCAAIPVGSALGYVLGGLVKVHLDWRWAFYLVTPPGLLLGLLCFTRRDPREYGVTGEKRNRATWDDYVSLFRTRSYVLNTFAQTAMTFAIGGLGFWMAAYLDYRHQPRSTLTLFGGSSS